MYGWEQLDFQGTHNGGAAMERRAQKYPDCTCTATVEVTIPVKILTDDTSTTVLSPIAMVFCCLQYMLRTPIFEDWEVILATGSLRASAPFRLELKNLVGMHFRILA